MIPPLDTPGQGTRRGAAIVECACVRDFQATLGHRPWPLCGSTHSAVALLPLAAELSTHTHLLLVGAGSRGQVYKEVLTAVAPSGRPSFSCGWILLPLPLWATPPPGDGQLSFPVWPLSGARLHSQDAGMTTPHFLVLLMSCSCPACASMRVLPTTTSLCVLLFQEKYFGTFYFESHSIFVMKKYKYICIQSNKPMTRG